MNRWYVLHVQTGTEKAVKDRIKQIHGVHAIVPMRTILERRSGKVHEVIRTLIPGYVFIRTELTDDRYYSIRKNPNVYTILGCGKPEPVKESEMQRILAFCQNGDIIGISDILLEGGKAVVVSGPLKGFDGDIVYLDRRKGRVKVRLNILDETKTVNLSVNVLQASGS